MRALRIVVAMAIPVVVAVVGLYLAVGNIAGAGPGGAPPAPAKTFGSGSVWHNFFCIGNEACDVGDFNADGRDDIVTFVKDTKTGTGRGDVYVSLSTGSGFAASSKWHEFLCVKTESCDVGDFNGDGRDDIAAFVKDTKTGTGRGDVWVALSTGSGFGTSSVWHDFFCVGSQWCDVGDFNGDGRDDIAAFNQGTSGDVFVALSSGSAFGTSSVWHNFFCTAAPTVEWCEVGDVNADGKDDIVTFTITGTDVYVALSSGSGFGASSVWHSHFCTPSEWCGVGDFNGDGRDDIVTFIRDSKTGTGRGDVYVALSTGSGFGTGAKWHDFFCIGQEVCADGDFDGDGRDDIALFKRDTAGGSGRGDVIVALSKPAATPTVTATVSPTPTATATPTVTPTTPAGTGATATPSPTVPPASPGPGWSSAAVAGWNNLPWLGADNTAIATALAALQRPAGADVQALWRFIAASQDWLRNLYFPDGTSNLQINTVNNGEAFWALVKP